MTQKANTSNLVTNACRLFARAPVVLCAMLGASLLLAASAQATVSHEFLSGVTAELNQPLPTEGQNGEPPPVPFAPIKSMTVDEGELYVAQSGTEKSKIDKFNSSSGAFLSQLPQLPEPLYLHQGVVVGHSTGEAQLYVAGDIYPEGKQTPRGAIAVLTPQGALKSIWTGSDTPAGRFDCFECEGPGSIAVDDSTSLTDSAAGDVYVADEENRVVDVFKPQAGGGEKYVTQLTGPEPPSVLFPHLTSVAVNQTNGEVIVNTGEAVYLFRPAPIAGQYEMAGTLTPPPSTVFQRIESIATDGGNGDIYLAEAHAIYEYNSNGEYTGALTGTGPGAPFLSVSSVAIDPVSHDVFVADFDEHAENKPSNFVDAFGPDIVTPDVTTDEASGVSPRGAVLRGEVNPRGAGQASCQFVYGTSPEFGREAPCAEPVADGSSFVPVHALLSGLESGTTYFYRLQATNKNGTNPGEAFQNREFSTPGPGMRGESVSSVSSTSATLNATINPDKEPTSFYFQYGKSSEYEAAVPLAPGSPLGSGETDVEVSRHLQSLVADTVYHYRVVAVNEPKAGVTETFAGPDQTFTTQPAGTAFVLPDSRGWELVSPPNKHGARILSNDAGFVMKASLSGQAITYQTSGTTESNPQGYISLEQVLTSRGSGWSSQDIGLPHRSASGIPIGQGEEYRFFSEDLSAGLLEPQGEFTSLASEASPPDSERTLYVRHNSTCAATPATCYAPLVTGASGYADVPEGTEFGGSPNELTGPLSFKGSTTDLRHVVFYSTVVLSLPSVKQGLYEWSAGKLPSEELQLVSLLPKNGGPAKAPELGSTDPAGGSARNAISADGTRIVWTENGGHLYLRDTAQGGEGETVQLDVVQPGASGGGEIKPKFQIASSDGSKVFFTDEQRLTADAGSSQSSSDLYECGIVLVAGELRCKLSDLTRALQDGEGAHVLGVIGASEDGSSVYYVAEGVLGERAVPGASSTSANLYVSHYDGTSWGAPKLIAGLSSEDRPDWRSEELEYLTARVSPDGRWVAFMSQRQLTSYDNRDVLSGVPDEEAYLYDASGDGGAGSVVCASCRPTGARPEGVEYARMLGGTELAIHFDTWTHSQYIAASFPGWDPYTASRSLYQSRYLSDSGRLFFDAADALVPQDINNNEDVYEFEPVGVGDCSTGSSTFSVASGGCVGMISSGTATGESVFFDASENGNDVFFLTGEKLVAEDADTSLDLYDAHVCSSGWACPDVPSVPPACTTAEACRVAPTPQPAIFGFPASATFSGAGNVTPSGTSAGSVKTKTLTRVQKLKQALNVCHRRQKGKRAACERQARRLYGAKTASKPKTSKKKGR